MKNIILCGFMGCGKTTVGENLKKKSGMNLIDTDAYIEETEGMTISKIFEKYGDNWGVKNLLNFELEAYSDAGIWLAKKKYVKNVKMNSIIIKK